MRARISDSRSLRPSPRPGPIKSYGAVVPEVQFRRTLLGVFTCSAARTSRLGSVHADRPAYAPRLHPNADLSESPAPCVNVQIVGVDQGVVDVEQHAAVPELMRP